jgi:hypothetical protein
VRQRATEQTGGGLGREGAREQIPLAERASEIAQPRELLGILDSLGHGTQAQAVGERDDRAHERSVRLVVQASPPLTAAVMSSDGWCGSISRSNAGCVPAGASKRSRHTSRAGRSSSV